MLLAVAVCPPAPVLLDGLGGALDPAGQLRRRAQQAVGRLLRTGARRLVVVGEGADTRCWPLDAPFSVGIFTGAGGAGVGMSLPVALAVGRELLCAGRLDTSGTGGLPGEWSALAVAADEPPGACVDLGRRLADGADRVGLLVMADGAVDHDLPDRVASAARAADDLDLRLVRAIRTGDFKALEAIDPAAAAEVGCSSRAVWQVLAGAARRAVLPFDSAGAARRADLPVGSAGAAGRAVLPFDSAGAAQLDFFGAPFGVTYLIATWAFVRELPSVGEPSTQVYPSPEPHSAHQDEPPTPARGAPA